MAVRERDVEIRRPCPVRLDPDRARGGVRSWYCGHCEKSVHVLSNMTEKEARRFLVEREGEDICVTYAVRRDGSVRFRPEPTPAAPVVPVSALTRRRNLAAAAGLGMALAACTPHAHDDVQRTEVEDVETPAERKTPTIPEAPESPEPDEVLVDGEIEPHMLRGELPVEPMRAGGLRATPVQPTDGPDEPCDSPKADPPKADPPKADPSKHPMPRGRISVRTPQEP
jgi:hypothetical protein